MAAVAFMAVSSFSQAAPLSHLSGQREVSEAVEQLRARYVLCSEEFVDLVSRAVGPDVLVIALEATPQLFAGGLRFIATSGAYGDCSSDSSSIKAFGSSSTPSTPPQRKTIGKTEDTSTGERVALILRTSGTTSKPKVCPLRMADIVRNGQMIAQALKLTPADVCINAMPLFHIGGISASVLATIASGGAVLCMRGFKPQDFAFALRDTPAPRPTW
jgi:acyl-CoA synthetase (AMP-forming)/AMP-acid ligase II